MRITQDLRGQSFWDLFDGLPGQVNISITNPGQRRGPHMHQEKDESIVVISGNVVLYIEHTRHILGAGDLLSIGRGLWHGYQGIGAVPAIVAYYETAKSGAEAKDDLVKDWPEGWK